MTSKNFEDNPEFQEDTKSNLYKVSEIEIRNNFKFIENDIKNRELPRQNLLENINFLIGFMNFMQLNPRSENIINKSTIIIDSVTIYNENEFLKKLKNNFNLLNISKFKEILPKLDFDESRYFPNSNKNILKPFRFKLISIQNETFHNSKIDFSKINLSEDICKVQKSQIIVLIPNKNFLKPLKFKFNNFQKETFQNSQVNFSKINLSDEICKAQKSQIIELNFSKNNLSDDIDKVEKGPLLNIKKNIVKKFNNKIFNIRNDYFNFSLNFSPNYKIELDKNTISFIKSNSADGFSKIKNIIRQFEFKTNLTNPSQKDFKFSLKLDIFTQFEMNYLIQSKKKNPNVQLSSEFKNNVKLFNFKRKICLLNLIFYSNLEQHHQILETFKPLNHSVRNIKIPSQFQNIIRPFNFLRRMKIEEEKFSLIKVSIKDYDELQNILASNVPIQCDNLKITNQFEMKLIINSTDNSFKITEFPNNNNPIEIKINCQKHKLTSIEILKIIHCEFSSLSKVSKIFDYEINKLNKYLQESYNINDMIQIKNLDFNRKSKLFQFITKTFYIYNHIKSILDYVRDENNQLKLNLKSGNFSQQLQQDINRNNTIGQFLWKRSCQVNALIIDIQANKKICHNIKNLKKFLRYYKGEFTNKVEKLNNDLLHFLPDFNNFKRRITFINELENENNELPSKREFHTEQPIRISKRDNNNIEDNNTFIYTNIKDKFKTFFNTGSKKESVKDREINKLIFIKGIREEIKIINSKLNPIEEEYSFIDLKKKVKLNFDSKILFTKFINIFLTLVVVILIFLNLNEFYKKYENFASAYISYHFKSPIISISSEEYEKGIIEFD